MINPERLLATFCELVSIDNPSGAEAAMAAHVSGRLRALGLDPKQDRKGNLVTAVPGTGAPLLLSAHLDSVSPAMGKEAVVRDGVVYSAGDTVLGADDLAGVAAMIEAITALREAGTAHRAAELVFSVEEEIGLKGVKELDWSLITATQGVALDLNGPVGGICVAAPAHDTLAIIVHGRAAHAGVAPEAGISAIRVASEAISAMPLGRIDAETTANIGTIQGGAARNIVPDRVELIGEARSRDLAKLDRVIAETRAAFTAAAERHSATVELDIVRQYGPMLFSADSAIVQLCQRAVSAIGLQPALVETGGGSDVSVFNMHGVEAVNLCIGYHEIHSTQEHIAVADLVNAARLIASLLTLDPA